MDIYFFFVEFLDLWLIINGKVDSFIFSISFLLVLFYRYNLIII